MQSNSIFHYLRRPLIETSRIQTPATQPRWCAVSEQLGVPGARRQERGRCAEVGSQSSAGQAMTFAPAMVLLCLAAVSAARVLQQTDPRAFPGASPVEQATQAQARSSPELQDVFLAALSIGCYATITQNMRLDVVPDCCRC